MLTSSISARCSEMFCAERGGVRTEGKGRGGSEIAAAGNLAMLACSMHPQSGLCLFIYTPCAHARCMPLPHLRADAVELRAQLRQRLLQPALCLDHGLMLVAEGEKALALVRAELLSMGLRPSQPGLSCCSCLVWRHSRRNSREGCPQAGAPLRGTPLCLDCLQAAARHNDRQVV